MHLFLGLFIKAIYNNGRTENKKETNVRFFVDNRKKIIYTFIVRRNTNGKVN